MKILWVLLQIIVLVMIYPFAVIFTWVMDAANWCVDVLLEWGGTYDDDVVIDTTVWPNRIIRRPDIEEMPPRETGRERQSADRLPPTRRRRRYRDWEDHLSKDR